MSGFPAKVEFQDVVNFINQNLPGFRYLKLTVGDGHARLTLQPQHVAEVMAKLHGFSYMGKPLVVQVGASAGVALKSNEREALRNAVRNSFSNNALNLTALAQTHGLPFANFGTTSFVTELLNAIQFSAPEVVSINLAQNQIQSLAPFAGLLRVAPKLQNLSLMGNYLASVEQLEHLSGFKTLLRELLLTGNPLCQLFTPAPGAPPQMQGQLDYTVYQQYLSSLFPQLRMLDSQPMRPLIEFDLPAALSSTGPTQLPPLLDSFFDSDAHKAMCLALVGRYFTLYDRERTNADLVAVYAEKASFSLAYTPDSRHANKEYTALNRNFVVMGPAKTRGPRELSLLKVGPVAILTELNRLPSSKHDIDGFVADVLKVPTQDAAIAQAGGLLHITIRGQFQESESMIRCFHRVFLCTPPTADARSKNWPVSILHDSLYIGAAKQSKHAARAATREEVMAAAAALTSPSKRPDVVIAGVKLNEHDQSLVEGLVRATGVDPETATKLLMECKGNVEQAMDFIRQQQAAAAGGRPSI